MHESGLWKLVRRASWRRAAAPFFDPDAPTAVPWVLGAALAVRRSAFDAAGGFDERYFMYYEEVDLCRRLADAGVATRFTPAAAIGHVGGASTRRSASMEREVFRSLARYLRTHGRSRRLVRLRLVVVVVAFTRCARDLVVRRSEISRRSMMRTWMTVVE